MSLATSLWVRGVESENSLWVASSEKYQCSFSLYFMMMGNLCVSWLDDVALAHVIQQINSRFVTQNTLTNAPDSLQ